MCVWRHTCKAHLDAHDLESINKWRKSTGLAIKSNNTDHKILPPGFLFVCFYSVGIFRLLQEEAKNIKKS